jgi:hypothetical protein
VAGADRPGSERKRGGLFPALDYRPAVAESDADADDSTGHPTRNRYNPPAPLPSPGSGD